MGRKKQKPFRGYSSIHQKYEFSKYNGMTDVEISVNPITNRCYKVICKFCREELKNISKQMCPHCGRYQKSG